MEIIYFIMVIFSESTLASVEIKAWHIYADQVGYDVPCERAIEDPKFQQLMGRKLQPGQKATLQCKSDPEMRALQFLLNPGAVRISPTATVDDSGQRPNDSGDTMDAAKAAPRELTGKLIHVPYESGRKSTAAYLGQEFFLLTKDLGRVALYPSDAVSKERLLKFVGMTITLGTRFVDRTPNLQSPNGHMQSYPIGEDGGPMKRQGYEVLQIKKECSHRRSASSSTLT
ncbi:MAG: hypothetical protein NXI24_02115 [bacterium]|nr:hypothetical protein [bacterium]